MESNDGTSTNRLIRTLDAIHDGYDRIVGRIRQYTPYVVRTIEVVLAIVLLAFLAHWLYLFFTM